MNFQFLFTTQQGNLSLVSREARLPSDSSGFLKFILLPTVGYSVFTESPAPFLSVLGRGFFVRSPCLLLFAENAQSLLMHLFKVHFKYSVFVNCIALQSACRRLLITGNGFASYFAWPRSFLSVSLSFERCVFFGQLPLCSVCNLMIVAYFKLYSRRVGKVTTSLGLT